METLFIKLLNMSITAGWLVIAVVLLRALLKKAPKSLLIVLWGFVALRLVCPFSLESVLSLIPSAETISPEIIYSPAPSIHSGIYALNTIVNPVISTSLAPDAGDSANPLQVISFVSAVVWLAGMGAMVLYSAISYLSLKYRVKTAVILRDNIYQSENVSSPFVLGIFRPRIFLPFGIEEGCSSYVLAHENAHIRRHDHWIKPVGFALLTVYWFNPLIWLAYILLCRDIELACDEKVIKEMCDEDKKAYSRSLLACSVPHSLVRACPLAFGEGDVRGRIKSILNYKKPAFWIIIAALLACAVLAVCFLTNPRETDNKAAAQEVEYSYGTYRGGELLGQVLNISYRPQNGSQYEKIEISPHGLTVTGEDSEIIFDSNSSEVSQMSRERLIKTFEEMLQSIDVEDIPEYESLEDMLICSYYSVEEPEYASYSVFWFDGQPTWFAERGFLRIYKLEPINVANSQPETQTGLSGFLNGDYLSLDCVFMHPLSSTFSNGENGYRYLASDSRFAIEDKDTGEIIKQFSPVIWTWEEMNAEQWSELFNIKFLVPDISGYSETLKLELGGDYYLFSMDGELWVGTGAGQNGMWSVYHIIPEGSGQTQSVPVDDLSEAIRTEVLEHYRGQYTSGNFPCESHAILEIQRDSNKSTVTVYLNVLYQEFGLATGGPMAQNIC